MPAHRPSLYPHSRDERRAKRQRTQVPSNEANEIKIAFTYAPEHDIPFISTDDIGDVAARYLLDDSWAGQWGRNLMGPENITLTQAARILSERLHKPVAYRQNSLDAAGQELMNFGLSQTIKQELIDLFKALGDPDGIYATARTPEDFTPTTFEKFVADKLVPSLNDN